MGHGDVTGPIPVLRPLGTLPAVLWDEAGLVGHVPGGQRSAPEAHLGKVRESGRGFSQAQMSPVLVPPNKPASRDSKTIIAPTTARKENGSPLLPQKCMTKIKVYSRIRKEENVSLPSGCEDGFRNLAKELAKK